MVKSNFQTKITREMVQGKKNPTPDMTNYKAKQQPQRKAAWLSEQKTNK
jgi:hypothetical protein